MTDISIGQTASCWCPRQCQNGIDFLCHKLTANSDTHAESMASHGCQQISTSNAQNAMASCLPHVRWIQKNSHVEGFPWVSRTFRVFTWAVYQIPWTSMQTGCNHFLALSGIPWRSSCYLDLCPGSQIDAHTECNSVDLHEFLHDSAWVFTAFVEFSEGFRSSQHFHNFTWVFMSCPQLLWIHVYTRTYLDTCDVRTDDGCTHKLPRQRQQK